MSNEYIGTKIIGGIDWAQLQKQKDTLVKLMGMYNNKDRKIAQDIAGIIHLIDFLQDTAVNDSGISEKCVFGD